MADLPVPTPTRRGAHDVLRTGVALALAAGLLGIGVVVRSALACPPSYSPTETFDLSLESVIVDGVAVQPGTMDPGDVGIRASMREDRVQIYSPSGGWATYERR